MRTLARIPFLCHRLWLLALLHACCLPLATAQSTVGNNSTNGVPLIPDLVEAATATNALPSAASPAAASLEWWNRPIVVFRSEFTRSTPEERAATALGNLEANAELLAANPVTTAPIAVNGETGYRFLVETNYLFAILQSDLDELSGISLDQARDEVVARLETIRELRADGPGSIARGVAFSLIATVVFIVIIVVLSSQVRRLGNLFERVINRFQFLNLPRVDLRPHVAVFIRQLSNLTAIAIGIAALCAYLAFVFRQFPLTAPWGSLFREHLVQFGGHILSTVFAAIPGLIIAVLILVGTRWLASMLSLLLGNIGQNTPGAVMSPETAKATRRIAVVAVWLFGIVLAYPYLPGSGSQAFKGVSVLLGLMVSLGSAGMVNQVMSGFVLLYSGSVRTGEYIQVGEIEGKITEIGFLAVKLLTPRREFLTIPNAVMLSNPTTNFSRLKDRLGVPVTCQLTVGYDAPWRRVHELLLQAATQTEGVMEKPPATVVQKALSDWYPEYVLTCYVENPEKRTTVLSDLNGHIQDAFNEAGIQIMSPHYRQDPPNPIVIPKDRWFPPGSQPDTTPLAADRETEK